MADTITTYIGNGTQTDFSVPFDYLKKSFVRVYVDNTLLTGGDYGDTTVDYYFLDKTTVRLKTPPANGVEVTIRRYTSATERIVSFEDASILKATDLDTSQLQSFHIAEEARDIINDALVKDLDGNWDALGNRITNVGDPVEGKDAINLDWYNKDAGKVQENANKTEQWRNESKGFRNEAEGFRNEAETFKDEAEESSNLAKDWAIKMDGKVVEDDVEVDYSAKYWATSIKEYGEASIVVADNIEDVKTVADNIDSVTIVGGDLEGTLREPFVDMGRVGTGSSDSDVEITGGNIKIVADNIEDVQNVVAFIESGQAQVVIDSVETTNQNVIKAKQSEDNAKSSENLAKDWAVKMDGLVNNEDYSSKYYAQQAKNSSDAATDTSEKITQAVTEGIEDISTATSQAVSQVETATQQSITQVNQAGTTQAGLVEQEGTDQVALVTAEGTKQVDLVQTAGTSATEAISTAKDSAVSSVTSTGTSQVEAVNTASSTAQSTINNLVSTTTTNINASVQKAQDWAEKTDGPVEEDKYSAKYWATKASLWQVQVDWNEADSSNVAYIKNKPDLTVYALKTDITTVYRYKGSVDTYSQLPVASQVVGDVYNIATDDSSHGIKAGDNVAWNGSYWDNLSGYVDLSPYLTRETASSIYLRQDTAQSTYAAKSELGSYATKQEVATGLSGKSDTNHTHTTSQVTDFTAKVQSLINSSRITDYGRVGS